MLGGVGGILTATGLPATPRNDSSSAPDSVIKKNRKIVSPKSNAFQQNPKFIAGLYQDEDLRLKVFKRQGDLTFYHRENGDIDISINIRESSIPDNPPTAPPPMSRSTPDWAALYGPGSGNRSKPSDTKKKGGKKILTE